MEAVIGGELDVGKRGESCSTEGAWDASVEESAYIGGG